MTNPLGIHFKISTLFPSDKVQGVVDSLLSIFSGDNTMAFLEPLRDRTFYLTFASGDDNAGYVPAPISGNFYDIENGVMLPTAHAGPPGLLETISIGGTYLLNPIEKYGTDGQLFPSNLARTLFHELAHAVTTPWYANLGAFGTDGSNSPRYAGAEALAIAAENLIYAKDRNLPSRVGHGRASPAPSLDPVAAFDHVNEVRYREGTEDLVHKSGRYDLLYKEYYGTAADGGVISKRYRARAIVTGGNFETTLNNVTVTGQKTGLVTDEGKLSQTFTDVFSGILGNLSLAKSGLEGAAQALTVLRYDGELLPANAAGSQVYDYVSTLASVRLSAVGIVGGSSNELFTDRYGPYQGPINPSTLKHQFDLKAGTPSIVIGATGYIGPGGVDLSKDNETLSAADGGTNVLIAGGTQGVIHTLHGASGNDILIGGAGADEIDVGGGADLVFQSGGGDNVLGNGQTIFVASNSNASPEFDTRAPSGHTLFVDDTALENVSAFMGNRYRTTFVGNGKTPQTFIAGAGGGDFTLTNGDVAIGNPKAVNIYRLSTDLVDGGAPTVSILNLGPSDIVYIDGKRFNGNVHSYNLTPESSGLSYLVNEKGTSTWGTEYSKSRLKENYSAVDTVRPFNPVDDLPGALEYLKLWGLDGFGNPEKIRTYHDHPDDNVIVWSQEQLASYEGYFPAHADLLFIYKDADGNLPHASDYDASLPGRPLLEKDPSDLILLGDRRRDVAYVEAGGSSSNGTIVFSDVVDGTQLAGLNLNVTGFQNGVSAGLYFSTNDLTWSAFPFNPVATSHFGPDDPRWQNVYPSQNFAVGAGGFLDLSTPASTLGQPYNPLIPTTLYDNFVFNGAGDVASPDGPPPLTLTGDAGANTLTFGGTYSIIEGGGGGDTIHYARGDGSVWVQEADSAGTPNNTLALAAGITPDSVSVVGNGLGDILLLLDSGECIRLQGALGSANGTTYGVQHVTFATGTSWSFADLLSKAATASETNRDLYGDGSAQDFALKTQISFFPGHGDVPVHRWGPTARSVTGGGGGDTMLYGKGYGAVTVNEADPNSDTDNMLRFAFDVSPDMVSIDGDVNGSIILDLGGGDRIQISGALANSPNASVRYGLQAITFVDGTTWTQDDLVAALATATGFNNTLYGDGYSQTFDTFGQARGVVGGGGGDTFVYAPGYGPLVINELDTGSLPVNVLQIDAGLASDQARVFTDRHGNVVLDFGGQDRITLAGALLSQDGATRGVQQVVFAGEDVTWSYEDLLARALTPAADNTHLYGDGDANAFDSLGIATSISGAGGGDSFIYQRGYGQLTISEADTSASPQNILEIGEDILPGSVTVTGDEAGDLILDFGSGDKIILDAALRSTSEVTRGVQQIVFDDGTIWTYADLLANISTPTASNLSLYGDSAANSFDSAGIARSISGGGGGDVVLYDQGYGPLEISEVDDNSSPANAIHFGAGLDRADLSVAGTPEGDLILSFGGGDRITMKGALASGPGLTRGVQQLMFADGTSLGYADLLALTLTASAGNASIFGDSAPNLLDGLGIAHSAYGGGGGDTFAYARGSGTLTIYETDVGSNPDNLLSFGEDIDPAEVDVAGDPQGDLILSLGDGDEVILSKALLSDYQSSYGVQQISFPDGTVWTYADLLQRAETPSAGTSGIYGDTADNILSGNGLAHVLVGNGGGDTFIVNPGDGAVSIEEYDLTGQDNVLQFGSGISAQDVSVTGDASGALVLALPGDDQVTIAGALNNVQGSGSRSGVQAVRFADGTIWSYDMLVAMMAPTSAGVLYGDDAAQDFDGAASGSTIVGKGGGDTFHFGHGHGTLVIDEIDTGEAAFNILRFAADVTPASVSVSSDASGNVLLSLGDGDVVTVLGMLASPPAGGVAGLQSIVFANGVTWDAADVADFIAGGNSYNLGDAPLTIDEAAIPMGMTPTISLAAGILPGDVSVTLAPGGNELELVCDGDTIVTFLGALDTAGQQTTSLEFDDGTRLTLGELFQMASLSDVGTLFGTGAGETFDTRGDLLKVTGGGGGDSFLYNKGYGILEIAEAAPVGTGDNILYLGAGITAADVTVNGQLGGDLVLNLGGADQIILTEALKTDGVTSHGVDHLHFADGTTWTYSDLVAHAASPLDGNLTLFGDGNAQTLDMLGMATGVVGNGGGDTIIYNAGYGRVTIDETDADPASINSLALGPGIAPGSITVKSDYSGGFYLTLNAHDDISILNARKRADGLPGGVQQVIFADGTTWTYADLLALSEIPSSDNRTLFGDIYAQTLDTQGIARGVVGDGGGDTFLYNHGYGAVLIEESDLTSAVNTLQLGAGLLPSGVILDHVGNTVTLSFGSNGSGSTDIVTLSNQLASSAYTAHKGVQRIVFGDGTIWTKQDVLDGLVAATATHAPAISSGGAVGASFSETADGAFGDSHSVSGSFQFTTDDPDQYDQREVMRTGVTITGSSAGLPPTSDLLLLLASGSTDASASNPGHIGWSFNAPDPMFDYIAEGETLSLSYSFAISDNLGRTTNQNVTINISGANDAPLIEGGSSASSDVATGDIDDPDAIATAGGFFSFSDLDLSDIHTATVTGVSAADDSLLPDNATLLSWLHPTIAEPIGDTSGKVEWTFSAPSEDFWFLPEGWETDLSYTIDLQDAAGANASLDLTMRVTAPGGETPDEDIPAGFTSGDDADLYPSLPPLGFDSGSTLDGADPQPAFEPQLVAGFDVSDILLDGLDERIKKGKAHRSNATARHESLSRLADRFDALPTGAYATANASEASSIGRHQLSSVEGMGAHSLLGRFTDRMAFL